MNIELPHKNLEEFEILRKHMGVSAKDLIRLLILHGLKHRGSLSENPNYQNTAGRES